jgi:hypothetical protein
MQNDYQLYRPRLLDYLSARGMPIDTRRNFACINPDHDDSTASMSYKNDRLHCFGCGFDGDIYDVAGLLDGIADPGEQYRAVAAHFGDSPAAIISPRTPTLSAPDFMPDLAAIERVQQWMIAIRPAYEPQLAEFAKARGYDSGYAAPLLWWPGLKIAQSYPIAADLEAAGIIDSSKPKCAWTPPGAVVVCGLGFKLHYIDREGKTIKRETRGGHTFDPSTLPTGRRLILVEGELDELSARYAGFDEARSMGGTNGLTESDAGYIAARGYSEIVLAFDNDDPGRIAAGLMPAKVRRYTTVPTLLRSVGYNGEIKHAVMPEGCKDIDDAVKGGKRDEVRHAIFSAANVQKGGESEGDSKHANTMAMGGGDKRGVQAGHGVHGGDNGQGAQAPVTLPPFQFLGFDDQAHYVLPCNQNIALRIPRGEKAIKDKIGEFADPDWWFANFNKEVIDRETGEPKTVFDYPSALQWFRASSTKRGMYSDDLLLGVGAHMDDGHAIVNTGRAVVYPGGKVVTYEEYTGKNAYCRSPIELKIDAPAWTREDSVFFIKQLKTFSFESEISYYAIAGWCAVAPFASLLFRRPHLWITARRGMGKTWLMHELIYPITGLKFTYFRDGLTTEAAIRQNLRKDNRPVILDEFEIGSGNVKNEEQTINGVLKLARTSYGGDEGISKGTSSQSGINFAAKMMFCFGSINVNLQDAADKSRIVICRMDTSVGKMQRIPNPDGIRSRMLLHLDRLRSDIDKCTEIMLSHGYEQRTCDTYSPLYAGFWRLLSEADFGDDSAPDDARMLGKMVESWKKINATAETVSDEESLFQSLFQFRSRLEGGEEKTTAEMLTEKDAMGNLKYSDAIGKRGMRRYNSGDGKHAGQLAISTNNTSIREMLEGASLGPNYKEVLKRHHSYIESETAYIGGVNQAAMFFRWSDLEARFFNSEGLEDLPF